VNVQITFQGSGRYKSKTSKAGKNVGETRGWGKKGGDPGISSRSKGKGWQRDGGQTKGRKKKTAKGRSSEGTRSPTFTRGGSVQKGAGKRGGANRKKETQIG